MIPIDSLSSEDRVEACPGSGAGILPAAGGSGRPAVMGTALHEHMHMRAALGVDAAVERIGETAARWGLDEDETRLFAWRCRTFEWSPPPGAFGEVALCLREDGSVVRVKGGRGTYEVPEDAVPAGTLDVMWSEPEPLDMSDPEHPRCPPGSILWVGDYKSGSEEYVVPAETNLQLAGEATLAAKWTGAAEVMPAIIFVRPGQGEWDSPANVWAARELARAEQRLRAARAAKVGSFRAMLEGRPQDVRFNEGPWCELCKSRFACPPKVAMLRAVAGDPNPLLPAEPTEEQLRFLAIKLKDVAAFATKLREYLKGRSDERRIPLGNGLEWGPVVETTREIVPRVALPVLLDELGEETAYGLLRLSKSAIEDAVRTQHETKGIKRQLAPTMRRILARVEEDGGIRTVAHTEYRAHRVDSGNAPPPKPALENLLEASIETAPTPPASGPRIAAVTEDPFAAVDSGPL